MTGKTPTGAQAAILNCQVQEPKIMRRILKTTAPYACTLDKKERMLPFIEHQLYTKPFLVVIFLKPSQWAHEAGLFLSPLYS